MQSYGYAAPGYYSVPSFSNSSALDRSVPSISNAANGENSKIEQGPINHYTKPHAERTFEDHHDNVKAVEKSVMDAYHEMELSHYEINQKKSEDYTTLFHLSDIKATEFRLRFEVLKGKLSKEVKDEATDILIPAGSIPDPSLKPHPFEELKAIHQRIYYLRGILEKKVKEERASHSR